MARRTTRTAGDPRTGSERESQYQRIFAVVDSIPRGKVLTYGRVASEAGLKGHARQVGYALKNLPPKSELPWHRVLNAAGKISLGADSGRVQKRRLESEGVRFEKSGRISLQRYLWHPD